MSAESTALAERLRALSGLPEKIPGFVNLLTDPVKVGVFKEGEGWSYELYQPGKLKDRAKAKDKVAAPVGSAVLVDILTGEAPSTEEKAPAPAPELPAPEAIRAASGRYAVVKYVQVATP